MRAARSASYILRLVLVCLWASSAMLVTACDDTTTEEDDAGDNSTDNMTMDNMTMDNMTMDDMTAGNNTPSNNSNNPGNANKSPNNSNNGMDAGKSDASTNPFGRDTGTNTGRDTGPPGISRFDVVTIVSPGRKEVDRPPDTPTVPNNSGPVVIPMQPPPMDASDQAPGDMHLGSLNDMMPPGMGDMDASMNMNMDPSSMPPGGDNSSTPPSKKSACGWNAESGDVPVESDGNPGLPFVHQPDTIYQQDPTTKKWTELEDCTQTEGAKCWACSSGGTVTSATCKQDAANKNSGTCKGQDKKSAPEDKPSEDHSNDHPADITGCVEDFYNRNTDGDGKVIEASTCVWEDAANITKDTTDDPDHDPDPNGVYRCYKTSGGEYKWHKDKSCGDKDTHCYACGPTNKAPGNQGRITSADCGGVATQENRCWDKEANEKMNPNLYSVDHIAQQSDLSKKGMCSLVHEIKCGWVLGDTYNYDVIYECLPDSYFGQGNGVWTPLHECADKCYQHLDGSNNFDDGSTCDGVIAGDNNMTEFIDKHALAPKMTADNTHKYEDSYLDFIPRGVAQNDSTMNSKLWDMSKDSPLPMADRDVLSHCDDQYRFFGFNYKTPASSNEIWPLFDHFLQ